MGLGRSRPLLPWVAILCKEQIRSEQAKQEAERLQREIELRLFEEEELNRKKHLVEETTQEESLEAERAKIEKLTQDIEQKESSKREEIDKLYKRETDLYKYKFKIINIRYR